MLPGHVQVSRMSAQLRTLQEGFGRSPKRVAAFNRKTRCANLFVSRGLSGKTRSVRQAWVASVRPPWISGKTTKLKKTRQAGRMHFSDVLRKMEPAAFERLCQRILRESGFTKVEVTGRSGDGGIDGAGVLRVNLISFHVRFQCKRYTGSVGAPEIRNFRGAMVGRGDKGLFMTTGNFTREAEREAVRDGAPAIDLISGSELCNLLKELELGVTFETVQVVKPIPEFFASI